MGSTSAATGSKNRDKAKLTRSKFPAGSPGWLYLQALILIASVENKSSPEKTEVVEFPDFDVREDGSLVVYSLMEGLEEGQRHQEYRFTGRMGSIMRDSMISAFASELALKAISLTCKDEAIKTHDLRDLFADLPEECQGRLTADFPEIEGVLEQGRQTFGDWRYFEQALQGKGMVAMIDVARARALGKAARVILDEAAMMGLRGSVDLEAKENVQGSGSRRNYKQEYHGTVTGGEWPPRVFAGGKGRKR